MAGLNAQTSPLTISANMGAATADPLRLPSLSLNRYGVYFAKLPVPETELVDQIVQNNLNTDPLYPTNLPALELTAQTATVIRIPPGRAKKINTTIQTGYLPLPVPTLSASVGFEVKSDLPTLTAAGEIIPIHSLTLDVNLSELRIEASTGIRCGDLRINPLQLEIEANGYLTGSLDRSIPGLSLSSSASSPWPANLSTSLPPLSITVEMSGTGSGGIDKSIPALTIAAAASLNDYAAAALSLPSLTLTDATAHQETISMSSTLPAIVLQIIATGQDVEGLAPALTDRSRFTDYVLRHAR